MEKKNAFISGTNTAVQGSFVVIPAEIDGHIVMLRDSGTREKVTQQEEGYKPAPVRQTRPVVHLDFFGERTFKEVFLIAEIEIDSVSCKIDVMKQIEQGALDAAYAQVTLEYGDTSHDVFLHDQRLNGNGFPYQFGQE